MSVCHATCIPPGAKSHFAALLGNVPHRIAEMVPESIGFVQNTQDNCALLGGMQVKTTKSDKSVKFRLTNMRA